MPAGPGQIIGSASTDVPYMMYVNNSGAVPMAGYRADVVHPLLVDGAGALLTSASVSVGSIEVNVGSKAFMFGSSGIGWNAVLVDADGKLETTASVTVDSVFIASGANIGSVHVNNLTDLGSTVVIDAPATIGSYTTQTVDATDLDIRDLTSTDVVTTVQATQSNLKSEVYQGTDPWIVLGSSHINNLTDLGSTVVIDNPSAIGSYTTQLINGSVHVDNLTDLGSSSTQGTNPWIVLGSTHVNNLTDLGSTIVVDAPSTIGSLAIQTIGGSVAITTIPISVSGTVYTGSSIDVQSLPTDGNMNNPSWSFEYDASGNVGSVYQMIGAGSFVNTLTWAGYSGTLLGIGSRVTNVSLWSIV